MWKVYMAFWRRIQLGELSIRMYINLTFILNIQKLSFVKASFWTFSVLRSSEPVCPRFVAIQDMC